MLGNKSTSEWNPQPTPSPQVVEFVWAKTPNIPVQPTQKPWNPQDFA